MRKLAQTAKQFTGVCEIIIIPYSIIRILWEDTTGLKLPPYLSTTYLCFKDLSWLGNYALLQ